MIVRSEYDLNQLLEAISMADRWSFDTELVLRTYPDWYLVGFSISVNGVDGYYIPVGHEKGNQLSAEFVIEKLKPFFETTGKIISMHNAKFDMEVVRTVDPTISFDIESIFCTMTASFTLDTNNTHNLKDCADREFGKTMIKLDEFVPREKCPKTNDKVYRADKTTIEEMSVYAIDDAVQTFKLGDLYKKRIADEGYDKVFYELEMPFILVLIELEEQGVKLDKEKLTAIMEEAPKTLEKIKTDIMSRLPKKYNDINLNSTKQLNALFFKEFKLKPIGEKTKTGLYSVSIDNLKVWALENEVCSLIVDYRKYHKLLSTYISNMYNRLGADGRLRGTFNRHVAATGRLSSSKPNLQNIPTKRNDVYGLRNLFLAEKGKKLIVADYSQIELRMEAHLSKDPAMIQAFIDGEDLHSLTAKAVYKLEVPVEEVKDKYPVKRSVAKALNFGLIYEAGNRTLATTANGDIKDPKDHVTEKEMEVIRKKYFKRYPGIERYIESCHRFAESKGYMKTITGRKRYIPEAQLNIKFGHSKQEKYDTLRQKYGGFRKASNLGAQGGAADLLAIAMRNIYKRLRDEDFGEHAKFVLQVHDELAMEVSEEYAEPVSVIVKEEMESAVKLRVPLVADLNIVNSWGDAK